MGNSLRILGFFFTVILLNGCGGSGREDPAPEPTNTGPIVNVGIDFAVSLTNTATLSATISDDGLPNNTLTFLWEQISGPGTATFTSTSQADTTVNFSQVGIYQLSLTVSDGALSSSDSVLVTVNPLAIANQAPIVNAGIDRVVTLPNSLSLSATATDDGLPNNTLTYAWQQQSGPGTVTFSTANQLNTSASFSIAGTYVIRIAVNDGALISTDNVTVVVNGPMPVNQAPLVNAGNDITVTLPTQANLNGSATDDGLPNNSLTLMWIMESGPTNGIATFSSPNQTNSNVNFSAPGIYQLRLSADDGALSSTDTVLVTVSAAGSNQPPVVDAGNDQTITLPAIAMLNASVTDDGLPNNTLVHTWAQVSGPGTASFQNTDQVSTSVSFSTDGTYTLSLQADDGDQTTTDTITITVNPLTSPTLVIDRNTFYQTIVGWEGTDDVAQISPSYSEAVRNSILDKIVNEVGVNRIRLEVRAGAENTTDYFANWRDAGYPESPDPAYTVWREHRYTTVNDNSDPNSLNMAGFHFTELDRNINDLVIPLRNLLQARGESLWINLCYVAFTGQNGAGTNYHHADAAEYGEFIQAVHQHMQSTYGFVPDSVEIILEPDNSSEWNGIAIGNALANTGPRLLNLGYTPRFVAPSTSAMNRAEDYFFHPTTGAVTIPNAFDFLFEYSYHRYKGSDRGGDPGNTTGDDILQQIANRASNLNVGTAHLEFIDAHYDHLYRDLAIANNSSWSQYTIAGTAVNSGGNYLHWQTDGSGNVTTTMNNRTPFLVQYMRYVRAGYVRIDTNMDGRIPEDGGWRALAFESPSQQVVVVATIGTQQRLFRSGVPATGGGTQTLQIQGLPAGTYTVTYSTANNALVDSAPQTIISGQILTATIPDYGVLTVHQ